MVACKILSLVKVSVNEMMEFIGQISDCRSEEEVAVVVAIFVNANVAYNLMNIDSPLGNIELHIRAGQGAESSFCTLYSESK